MNEHTTNTEININGYVYNKHGKTMPRGRPVSESAKKRSYHLTLNPELVDKLLNDYAVDNLSGWINDQIRERTCLGDLQCPHCKDLSASIAAWRKWEHICPKCGQKRIDT